VAFAARTYARNFDWADDLSLWTAAVQTAPRNYKAHMALASAYASPAGGERLDNSIAEIEKAYAILDGLSDEQNSPPPFIDGGSYYGQKGESLATRNPDGSLKATPESLAWYRKALQALLHAQRIEAAENRKNRRLAELHGKVYKAGGWYELYLELGAVYFRLSEPRKALEALNQGRRFKPVPEFFERSADALDALGDSRRAAVNYAAAALMDPGERRPAALMARLYQRIDPSGCELRSDKQGLNLECPAVHEDFCAAAIEVDRLYRESGLDAAAQNARQTFDRDLHCSAGVAR
jgi:hypothetical protein